MYHRYFGMRRLSYREVKQFSQGCGAEKRQTQDSILRLSDGRIYTLNRDYIHFLPATKGKESSFIRFKAEYIF